MIQPITIEDLREDLLSGDRELVEEAAGSLTRRNTLAINELIRRHNELHGQAFSLFDPNEGPL